MNLAEKDTLYYDGQCPLCRKEAERLHRLAATKLELADIHKLSQDPTLPPRRLLLRRLHLRRADQSLVTGLDANIEAWQHTRLAWCWRLLRMPLVAPAAHALYALWARWRFSRLYGDGKSGGHEGRPTAGKAVL